VIMLRDTARPLDYDALAERIGDARFVFIGEATHGTHEFYEERARITQRLIMDRGFDAVAIEGDWPDAFRVNRYVRGEPGDTSAAEALDGFRRFPTWMWRNEEVIDFVEWLHGVGRAGFYGLDLYSMFASIDVVLHRLKELDPAAAARARARYACFDHFGGDTTMYAYASALNVEASCEREVTQQLVEMRARYLEQAAHDDDDAFDLEQNARLVKNAEEYYRHMLHGSATTWNLRDRHMADTLAAIVQHLDHRLGRPARVVVWAHNSHVGDARATEMGSHGEWTLGQLVRERYGREAVLVGFTTHRGTVIAASEWEGPAERKRVRPGLPNSYEELFHRTIGGCFLLLLRNAEAVLDRPMLERAIGVVYLPDTERASHYFSATLTGQFDAVVHLDETTALEPLDPIDETQAAEWDDAAETYPTGL